MAKPLRVVINGKFMGERMQGIVRYAREMVVALDRIVSPMDVILLLPADVKCNLDLRNIRCENYGTHGGMLWEQLDLARYLRINKECVCVNLCNIAPIFAPAGITVIHDIMYKVNPDHYTTLRNRLSRYWHMFQYTLLTRRERWILTDSLFSQHEIEKYYPNVRGRISVIPCAWQHVLTYKENKEWKKTFPFLKEGSYFFSLSTLSKNKNGRWIIRVAEQNPDEVFAIAGKYYETEDYKIPENVHMLGFVSDEDACALIKHSKAFIHPSLYEGFGLPPLEALALGTTVISSDATSLPEVLGYSVHYIDPNRFDINLERLLDEPVEDAQKALDRFSWEQSARELKALLAKVFSMK